MKAYLHGHSGAAFFSRWCAPVGPRSEGDRSTTQPTLDLRAAMARWPRRPSAGTTWPSGRRTRNAATPSPSDFEILDAGRPDVGDGVVEQPGHLILQIVTVRCGHDSPLSSPPLWVREKACSRGHEVPRSWVLPAQKCGWVRDYREGLSCSSLATIQLGSKSRTTWSPVPDETGAAESSPVCGSTKLTPAAIRVWR